MLMISFMISGIVLGLSAGISPGPLFALVIAETLQGGFFAGLRVAIAPFITDLPIIVFSLILASTVARTEIVLAAISAFGGLLLFYYGVQNFRRQQIALGAQSMPTSGSFRKGILVNILSPHPYLFWLTVGTPILFEAMNDGPGNAAAFLICFYAMLVGAKIVLAYFTGRSKRFLAGPAYQWTVKVLGGLLILFAILLFKDAWLLWQGGSPS